MKPHHLAATHPMHLTPEARRQIEQRSQQLRQQIAQRRAARGPAVARNAKEA